MKQGVRRSRNVTRLLRPTEIEGVCRYKVLISTRGIKAKAKKLGTFSSISLSLQEKVHKFET